MNKLHKLKFLSLGRVLPAPTPGGLQALFRDMGRIRYFEDLSILRAGGRRVRNLRGSRMLAKQRARARLESTPRVREGPRSYLGAPRACARSVGRERPGGFIFYIKSKSLHARQITGIEAFRFYIKNKSSKAARRLKFAAVRLLCCSS